MFLVRPYGYPLMLAAIFRVFGSSSPVAIVVVQHAMLVVVAVLASLIAWHATYRRPVALMTGLLTGRNYKLTVTPVDAAGNAGLSNSEATVTSVPALPQVRWTVNGYNVVT